MEPLQPFPPQTETPKAVVGTIDTRHYSEASYTCGKGKLTRLAGLQTSSRPSICTQSKGHDCIGIGGNRCEGQRQAWQDVCWNVDSLNDPPGRPEPADVPRSGHHLNTLVSIFLWDSQALALYCGKRSSECTHRHLTEGSRVVEISAHPKSASYLS